MVRHKPASETAEMAAKQAWRQGKSPPWSDPRQNPPAAASSAEESKIKLAHQKHREPGKYRLHTRLQWLWRSRNKPTGAKNFRLKQWDAVLY
jgi:hypothetical protein